MEINVPTTETGKRMIRSVSPIYDKAYTARWMFEVMGIEMEEARKYVDEFRLQAYPETATWGLIYWEQRYHIRTDERLTLEERRQKVIARRWKYSPMNPNRMETFIKQSCGRDAHVTEYNSEYRFEVAISGDGGVFEYDKFIELLRELKPSHLAMQVILETGCNVAIQPLPERYLFTARAAGTYPYRNVEGRPIEINIDLASDAEAHKFTSVPSGKVSVGTIPQRNTEGRLPAAEIASTAAAVGYTFESRLCGMPSRRL
ncbi:MAG: putative phage tail protein [Bacteroides sp.]